MTAKAPEPPSEPRPSPTAPSAATAPTTGPIQAPTAVSAYPGGSSTAGALPALPASSSTTASPTASATTTPAATTTAAPSRPVVNAALKKRPTERTPGRAASVVAVFALLIAAGAVLVALYSLNVAREAKSSAAAAASDADRLANPAPRPQATARPTVTITVTASPSPTRVYVPALVNVGLTIPPTEGCQSLYVDVDTAQVGGFTGHEFYFTSCVTPLSVRFDNVDAAAPMAGDTTPERCASQLLNGFSSPAPELQLPVTQGMTFCLLTSRAAASRDRIPQHLAVLQVRDIAVDRTVRLRLDTYDVPA